MTESRTGCTAMKCCAVGRQRFLLSFNSKLLGDYIYLFSKMARNKLDNANAKKKNGRYNVLKSSLFYVLKFS